MMLIAHHAGEELILNAAVGGGLLSGSLLFVRTHIAELARRRWRRHR